MSEKIGRGVFGDDGLYYGNEFKLDSFDRFTDDVLIARYGHGNSLNDSESLRIAVDIGCGTEAHRAFTLAQFRFFDQVYACDNADRENEVHFRNGALKLMTGEGQKPFNPIRFVKSNVLDLSLSDFEGNRAAFINCRRLPHYLPPEHFRDALKIIRGLAASEAVIALSFDFAKKEDLITKHESSILSSNTDIKAFYASRRSPGDAPHTTYEGRWVIAYMKRLGFTIEEAAPYRGAEDLRRQEFHILAYAPKLG